MSQNGSYIILVDCFRTCLTLAVFAPSVYGINKFYIYTIYARRASYHFLKLGNKYLDILTETGIKTCTQYTRIDKSFGQTYRLSVST